MYKPAKPICPFCKRNLSYKVFYNYYNIGAAYSNYNGLPINWLKSYFCRGSCSTKTITYSLWVNQDKLLIEELFSLKKIKNILSYTLIRSLIIVLMFN